MCPSLIVDEHERGKGYGTVCSIAVELAGSADAGR